MSRMSELYLDIELMLEQKYHPLRISQYLDVPVRFVYDVVSESTHTEQSAEEEVYSPFNTSNS